MDLKRLEPKLREEFESLEDFMSQPDSFSHEDYVPRSKRYTKLQSILADFEQLKQLAQESGVKVKGATKEVYVLRLSQLFSLCRYQTPLPWVLC